LLQAGHINDKLGFRRVSLGVILFGGAYDQIHNIGETAAAAAPLCHGVIHLGGNDQLPTVFVQKLDNRVADFPVGDVITATNQHSRSAWKYELRYLLFRKKTSAVKKKCIKSGRSRPMDGRNSGEWLILLFNPVADAFWNMP
jgi:hypothetical protein